MERGLYVYALLNIATAADVLPVPQVFRSGCPPPAGPWHGCAAAIVHDCKVLVLVNGCAVLPLSLSIALLVKSAGGYHAVLVPLLGLDWRILSLFLEDGAVVLCVADLVRALVGPTPLPEYILIYYDLSQLSEWNLVCAEAL